MLSFIAVVVAFGGPTTMLAGVPWKNSFKDAVKESQATGKPILHLQMFGKLSDEFC